MPENKLTNLKDAYKIMRLMNLKQSPSRSKAVNKATSSVIKKTPDQFRSDVKMDRDERSSKLIDARRTGVAEPPSEFSVGRKGAKKIKRKTTLLTGGGGKNTPSLIRSIVNHITGNPLE
tara:strand:+ start:654 stop:1010 length:357 start_codon:yes stop_codon:yes gene_type:complete